MRIEGHDVFPGSPVRSDPEATTRRQEAELFSIEGIEPARKIPTAADSEEREGLPLLSESNGQESVFLRSIDKLQRPGDATDRIARIADAKIIPPEAHSWARIPLQKSIPGRERECHGENDHKNGAGYIPPPKNGGSQKTPDPYAGGAG
jgi:hypothetical protein